METGEERLGEPWKTRVHVLSERKGGNPVDHV